MGLRVQMCNSAHPDLWEGGERGKEGETHAGNSNSIVEHSKKLAERANSDGHWATLQQKTQETTREPLST